MIKYTFSLPIDPQPFKKLNHRTIKSKSMINWRWSTSSTVREHLYLWRLKWVWRLSWEKGVSSLSVIDLFVTAAWIDIRQSYFAFTLIGHDASIGMPYFTYWSGEKSYSLFIPIDLLTHQSAPIATLKLFATATSKKAAPKFILAYGWLLLIHFFHFHVLFPFQPSKHWRW